MNAFFVIKRDGSRIGFDLQRITNAIKKAASAVNIVDDMYIHDLSQQINTEIFSHYQHEIDINQIQKIVEDHLMTSKYPQIARAYIEYRHDRDLAREKRSQLTKEIEGLIEQSNVELLNENANKDAKVIPTQRNLSRDSGFPLFHGLQQHLLAEYDVWHNVLPQYLPVNHVG